MKKFPEISVVMPVYNESIHDLRESINSILNQTYKNFEFIIIDDNPLSNNIKRFLIEKSKNDKRIKLIFNKSNLGVIRSSNKGMFIATGIYLSRMDADDIAKKNKLSVQLSFCREYNLDFACSNFSVINGNDEITKRLGYKCPTIVNQNSIKYILKHCNIAIGPTLFFKKRLFLKLNGYRNTNVEDYDLVNRFLINHYKIGYQDRNLIFKRLRMNSISYNSIYSQYIIMKAMSNYLIYDKIVPIVSLKKYVNNVDTSKLKHFQRFVKARYLLNNNKNIINVFRLFLSIVLSFTVICWCFWTINNKLIQLRFYFEGLRKMSILSIKDKIKRHIYKCFYKFTYKNIYKDLLQFHIVSIKETILELINTNKSIGRFGDGELRWLLNDNHDSFEISSNILSNKLKEVLENHNTEFMIGLPDAFSEINELTSNASNFWKLFFSEYGSKIIPYLNKNKTYYNTDMSRVYMDYRDKTKAPYYFNLLKKIWNNKKILIVEGNQSRLGVDDGLFKNTFKIYRIECPVINAFESYGKILHTILRFLISHPDYMTILSLGPTATILSYDLCRKGYRSIDIGHIDIEYNWYLMGARKKTNIKDKYVNEVHFHKRAQPIYNKKYMDQIISIIH